MSKQENLNSTDFIVDGLEIALWSLSNLQIDREGINLLHSCVRGIQGKEVLRNEPILSYSSSDSNTYNKMKSSVYNVYKGVQLLLGDKNTVSPETKNKVLQEIKGILSNNINWSSEVFPHQIWEILEG